MASRKRLKWKNEVGETEAEREEEKEREGGSFLVLLSFSDHTKREPNLNSHN